MVGCVLLKIARGREPAVASVVGRAHAMTPTEWRERARRSTCPRYLVWMLFGCSSFVLYRWIWPRQRRSVEALPRLHETSTKASSDNLPWLAVYGDSLSRGIFFDTIEALNGSDAARHRSDKLHPGHNANYSDDCDFRIAAAAESQKVRRLCL